MTDIPWLIATKGHNIASLAAVVALMERLRDRGIIDAADCVVVRERAMDIISAIPLRDALHGQIRDSAKTYLEDLMGLIGGPDVEG